MGVLLQPVQKSNVEFSTVIGVVVQIDFFVKKTVKASAI